jgi:hypothetical protein
MNTDPGLIFVIELLLEGGQPPTFEVSNFDRTPPRCGTRESSKHQLQDGLFAKGIRNDLEVSVTQKHWASILPRITRFGDLRRRILSWRRRTRISACNAARDRNGPPIARPRRQFLGCHLKGAVPNKQHLPAPRGRERRA